MQDKDKERINKQDKDSKTEVYRTVIIQDKDKERINVEDKD